MSVTVKGSGDSQTITGMISGTPPADSKDMTLDGVMIIAADGDGMEAHASFDIIVDAENDAPTRLELRVTEDDGFVVRTDEVDVDESDSGAVLGMLKVTDADDARHPHGMHTYTFMVDGEADSRFEVDMDGNLKLKDDESLNHEDDDEFVLKVTATDMAVGDDDSDTESVSLEITVTVKNVAAADRPVANKKIGDWWVTVDDDLEADDVRDGDWLSFRLDTTGDDAAFSHEDGDDLTYSVSVVDGDGNVVDWLQISDTGMMTNKADMLPDAGVYMVTVTATDEDGDSAQTTFHLAVALSDEGDRDNDTPDIRDVEEFDYEENSGAQKVASFSVRDDDVAIAPHPYGVLTVTFTATQEDDDDNVHPTLRTASRSWKWAGTRIPCTTRSGPSPQRSWRWTPWARRCLRPVCPRPWTSRTGMKVDITVTVTDGREEMDDKVITIDLDNDADEAPVFQPSAVDGGSGGLRSMKTTTVTVDQEATKEVIVVQLSEAWEDSDTDDDELDFSISGKGGLPDWVTVYGPDNWEDIYERQRDVDRGDGPSDVRDRDIVFAIVIDRSGAGDGDNESLTSAEFMVTARDGDGNSATEKIVIAVDDVNVDIATADDGKVVDINGEPGRPRAADDGCRSVAGSGPGRRRRCDAGGLHLGCLTTPRRDTAARRRDDGQFHAAAVGASFRCRSSSTSSGRRDHHRQGAVLRDRSEDSPDHRVQGIHGYRHGRRASARRDKRRQRLVRGERRTPPVYQAADHRHWRPAASGFRAAPASGFHEWHDRGWLNACRRRSRGYFSRTGRPQPCLWTMAPRRHHRRRWRRALLPRGLFLIPERPDPAQELPAYDVGQLGQSG